MPRVLATAAQTQMAMQQRASAAPSKARAAPAARALGAHPAGCGCTAHRRGRVVRAGECQCFSVESKGQEQASWLCGTHECMQVAAPHVLPV